MLNIINLYKSFSGVFAPTLKNINLKLLPGEFCILIGSNGSGKSTLLRSIVGEYQVDSGEIRLSGQDITSMPINLRSSMISSVYQDVSRGVVQEMTLIENLVLSNFRGYSPGCKFYSSKVEQIIATIKNYINNLGLEQYINKPLSYLSGGQRQIIAMLMAAFPLPKLLLLDEPTSALDPKTQKQLIQYAVDIITTNKITTLMVTHNLEDAAKYGNRLIMMHDGAIVLDLNAEQKKALNAKQLLELFHKYEDYSLLED